MWETLQKRVNSAVGDLHAADARCHESCRASFISAHHHKSPGTQNQNEKDDAFHYVCKTMHKDCQKTWNSTELFALYVDNGGMAMCRKTLFKRLAEYHGDNIVILSSPDFANIMGFRSALATLLHLEKNHEDDLNYCVDRVAAAVASECLALKKAQTKYHINIDKELVSESVSETTALLLSKISSKFDKDSLAMLLVGNIITGTVCSQTTDLQVALGVLLSRYKLLISELAKYSVCCSYDEVRLFRYSAAVHVAENYNEVGFGADDNSTIKHCIIDNFDAEISSPNCKACVH